MEDEKNHNIKEKVKSKAENLEKNAKKAGKEIRRDAENFQKKHKKKISKVGRVLGYSIAITINLILLYVTNNIFYILHDILKWDFPYLTDDFNQVIPYINISIILSIVTNLLFMFYDKSWFKNLGEIVTSIASIVATYYILTVFPFDLSSIDRPYMDTLLKALFILAMFGVGIAIIINIVKIVIYVINKEEDNE